MTKRKFLLQWHEKRFRRINRATIKNNLLGRFVWKRTITQLPFLFIRHRYGLLNAWSVEGRKTFCIVTVVRDRIESAKPLAFRVSFHLLWIKQVSCRGVANFSPILIAQSKDDLPLGELIYTYIVTSSDMEKRKLWSLFRKTEIGRANQVESLGGNWRKNELRDKNSKKYFRRGTIAVTTALRTS